MDYFAKSSEKKISLHGNRQLLGGIMRVEMDQFIASVRMRSPQARTWRDYRCDLDLLTHVIGDLNIHEVRAQHIDTFINYQLNLGFKPSTINRRLAAIVSFYRYLIDTGKASSCPVFAKRHYLREPQRLPRPVSEQELRQYFRAVDDVRDRAMFTLMLKCGLRIGEVSELEISDLYLGEAPSRMIIRGKGSKERTVFLTPGAEECLQNWLAQRSSIPDEHVFISYQRKKLSTTSINVRIQRTCQTSGVRLTAHRLRHTFADHLLSAGMPITSIQKLMGHRFVETTQNYAVANDRQVQADFYKACEKLEGWQLLTDAAQSSHTEITWKAQERRENVDAIYTRILTPNHVLSLPNELVRQLESYRQLKANRWRPERVESNSILFYSKQGILWKFFCEICAVRSVSDLRLDHVLQFIQARLDAGRSARTINCSLSSLRSFLIFLREDGVPIDPSLEHIQRLKENERLPRYITSEQVKRLRNEVEETVSKAPDLLQKQSALMMRSVFYLLWQGGLRSGEIEMLRFSDFYISKANQAKRLFIRDSKWRKGRAVYLTDVALEALKEYLAVRGMDQGGDFVFVRDGMPLKKNFLAGRIKAIGRQADVSVSPHRLRHTFATQLLNVGCKVTSIQKLLGHTDLNTTMTYARAFDQTVMLDYFQAVDVIESQPGGSWYQLNEVVL